MASDGPDPQSLKSWQDAFQYPIPTVRRVEKELRRDITSNKEKLRALVGTRYRELVGTAETIVSMNRDMEDVDTTLGDIGRRCNPRLISKKYAHLNQLNGEPTDQDTAKRALGAQLALLHRCSILISKLLRKRGSPLLTAKLLVISRLLHKNLSEQTPAPPFLDTLRNQLASLRRGLRSRIDKRLASAKSTIDEVIEALAAYCLATSSSSDDSIAYYHKIRLDIIGNQLEHAKASGENILNALRLYVQTLQISKLLLSRRLTDVLIRLKSRPLFTDPDVRAVDDLALDVLGRWVATDIFNFTPWIKLNELTKQDADRTIKKWSKSAFDEFVRRSQASLATCADFSQLLRLRKETLELWLRFWSTTPTHSVLQVLEGLRTVFNNHLIRILADNANALDTFSQAVASAVTNWDNEEHGGTQIMWDHELVSLDYSNGATAFKEAVTDTLLGRDEDISTVMEQYKDWLFSFGVIREAIHGLREVRWPDIIDEAADEYLDIDVTAILNEDDRQLLWEAFEAAVKQAFNTLQAAFSKTYEALGDSSRGEKAAFMIKLIRLVRRDLPAKFVWNDLRFSDDIVPNLQDILATEVIANTGPLSFAVSGSRPVPGRMLWEGNPKLPIQPSPSTFRFLRKLVKSMDRHGHGLWDSSTIHVLQNSLQNELAGHASSVFKELEAPTNPTESISIGEAADENGETKPAESPSGERRDDFKLQLYFDIIFLSNASTNKESKENPLQAVSEKLRDTFGSQAGVKAKTMDQRARDYWHRTRLLFGLLVVKTA
ncbi:hypothetical protein BJX70DRAFT_144740 [Aspergillus crustosus]